MGDFVLSLPVIRALAVSWPDADLEILGRPAIASLIQGQASRITSIDDQRFARLFADTSLDASDPAATYLASFDLVVTFLGVPESDFGARLRSLVPETVFISGPPPRGKHAVTHFLEQLRAVGIEPAGLVPQIDLSYEQREAGKRLLQTLLGTTGENAPIMVHPGSGGWHKNWAPELFAQTVRLFRQSGHGVVALEGEADQTAVRTMQADLQEESVPLLKDAALVQVASAIACSRLVIGNDSGISHLAAAVGTPVVCLFGPTDPAVWRPLGAAVRVLGFGEATPERVYAEGIKLARTNAD